MIYFSILLSTDAQEFYKPNKDTDSIVIRLETITFQWDYDLGKNAVQYSLQCGYRRTTPSWVITKVGNAAPTLVRNFRAWAEVANTVGNTTIGFKLKKCEFGDTGNMGCQMVIAGHKIYSKIYRFKIYGEFVHMNIFIFDLIVKQIYAIMVEQLENDVLLAKNNYLRIPIISGTSALIQIKK